MKTEPDIEKFAGELKKYMDVEREIKEIPSVHVIGCMCLDRYMCDHSCMHIYAPTFIDMHVDIYTCTYVYMYIYICIHVYIHIMHVHIHTYTCTRNVHVYTCMHACMHIHIHMCICTYVHT